MRAAPLIVALAGDPGGASALAPVLLALGRSGLSLRLLGYRQASALWRQRGLAVEDVGAADFAARLPQLLAGAALLLLGTSVNGEDLEKQAIVHAGAIGLPTLAVLDFWSNYRLRFAAADGGLILPDNIAVMDEAAVAAMGAAGFPTQRLVATGQPAFDELAAQHRAFTPARREALRQALGLGAQDLLISYVSQPFAQIHGSQAQAKQILGYAEDEVYALCLSCLQPLLAGRAHRAVLAVRPHPREDLTQFADLDAGNFSVRTWRHPDRVEAILASDLVLGMSSVLLLEAVLLGQLVVSIQPGLRGEDALPCNGDGRSLPVYRADKLDAALETALFDRNWRQRQLLMLAAKMVDGTATAALCQFVAARLGMNLTENGSA